MHGPVVPTVVIMGVSGSGKSTIGARLADALGGTFIEGDDLHSGDSKAKMAAGIPLDDQDRGPWLTGIAAQIRLVRTDQHVVVVACSALKRRYRDVLTEADPGLVFVHLATPPEVIARRLREREHEYMPASLLESQFSSLEPPTDDEPHVTVDVSPSPDDLVRSIATELGKLARRRTRGAAKDSSQVTPHR